MTATPKDPNAHTLDAIELKWSWLASPSEQTAVLGKLKEDDSEWPALLTQVGEELAEPLTAALERVTTLTTTGKIDRAGLRALREEIERARQAGIWCQQIARLASGRVKPSAERVHLTHTVQSVLAYRNRELKSRGITLSQSLLPIEVQVDAPLLFSLLNNLIDWWLEGALGHIDIRVDRTTWPERARLTCKFAHSPQDSLPTQNAEKAPPVLNRLTWFVLMHTAKVMGLLVDRQIGSSHAKVCIEFPHTISQDLPTFEELNGSLDSVDSVNSKPLSGSHVLVVSSRRDVRLQAKEALRTLGLVLDFATSIKEAAAFCHDGLPHAIVFDSELRTVSFDRLVEDIRKHVPEFVFIELIEGNQPFDISSVSPTGMARVGRDALLSALPSALVYELTRVM